MWRLVVGVAVSTITFAALLVVVRGIGGQARNPLADMFTEVTRPDGQTQVCWHNICPGQTTVEEAKSFLTADKLLYLDESVPVGRLCWVNTGPQEVKYICLGIASGHIGQLRVYFSYSDRAEAAIRLGDAVTLWGAPAKSSVGPLCPESYGLFGNNALVYTRDLSYAFHPGGDITFHLEARSRVDYVLISTAPVKTDGFSYAHFTNWQGFTSFQGPFTPCGGQ